LAGIAIIFYTVIPRLTSPRCEKLLSYAVCPQSANSYVRKLEGVRVAALAIIRSSPSMDLVEILKQIALEEAKEPEFESEERAMTVL
jgi:hypothetical protein